MRLEEVLFCATAPQSPEQGAGTIALHDVQSTTLLATFKQTSAAPRCTAVLESSNTQGGFMLAAQPGKSLLNVYNFQKDQIALKIVLPEKLTCIAIDKSGRYCAGGTAQGGIYLWEIASGILFNSWDAHYRRVNVLRFTNDGTVLISGSEDSSVNVWIVARLVDNEAQNDPANLHRSLSDHTLPITDIQCGVGAFLTCRILTSSADHTAKLWDLSTGTLLTTFQFPQIIAHLAWDVTERIFFAADIDGSIHKVHLFQQRKNAAGDMIQEAVGGGGTNDIVRVGDNEQESQKKGPIQVGESVSAMAISMTSTYLIVGTSTGVIHFYDFPSHQLVRTISTHKGFSITHLTSFLKPLDLIGHISLDLNVGSISDARDALPAKPVQPFQRMKDSKSREAHEVTMFLQPNPTLPQNNPAEFNYEEFLRDHASFVRPFSDQNGSMGSSAFESSAANDKISELEAQVAQLKEQLGKAKGINDAMWDSVVQHVMTGENGKQDKVESTEDGSGDSRRRKRSRGA
ncbi:hypothetical protein AGABI1DRAFT_118875 [Agaricus bisporus var. burnettii JB137-S8]|uniref:Pre-rRNA-processing protein IPI3 n=2 Tax=Agaricus bisporus var. burnettii TaxID=192524 RepID=K5Y1V2_AGABU|nr:uncharacterized protein AGABI1DRAFT_118875 [Agaricus bisporus var. burnettii JB137-S8]EKM81805.1 hypothetical protein AGABI1DRAFT_118875 [Agaricus bisporus var. burnettii JB137-S8]KAF7770482.1 hypothetical protein Agabi119p4_6456 [Agaricus bisporus var. burnettii]